MENMTKLIPENEHEEIQLLTRDRLEEFFVRSVDEKNELAIITMMMAFAVGKAKQRLGTEATFIMLANIAEKTAWEI